MIRNTPQPLDWVKAVASVALLAVFLLVSLATAQAATVTLAWTASSGSVAGYNVYTRTASGSYGSAQNAGTNTTYTTTDLAAGTYYFVVKARDSTGIESGPSNEVSSTTYTFTTQPSGLTLSYNGVSRVTPFTVRAAVGSSQQISAPATQSNYTFSSWSDGGAAAHAITIGALPQTITANYTSVVSAPVASCAVSPTGAATSTTITYTGSSSGGSVTTWSWNFNSSFSGGGTGSTVMGNYTNPGTYAASVTATGPGGSSTANCPSVTVTAAPPVASFSAATPTNGPAPLAVRFANASTGSAPLIYAWTFGDGSTSNERDPSHTYATTGTFNVNLTVTDSNNRTATAQPVSITTVAAASANNGLVAAYNFQEATGTVVVDESGKGNHGTLSCNTNLNSACTVTARTTSGKFGKALSFDGVDDWVTVNDSASLDLTNGMTLEAWVNPSATMSGWQSVITKEQPGGFGAVYYLAANSDLNQPEVAIYNTSWKKLYGGSAPGVNQWTHLAGTYDGATLRLYANGSLVSSQAQSGGGIQVTNGVLRIGGNNYWGEFFRGRIDEIRIYNRVLSANEIQTDMNQSVVTKLLVGNSSTTSSVTDSISQNVAEAFKKTATVTGKVTSVRVYVNSGSTSTRLVAGLYADNNGHPSALLAQGVLNNPTANSWNTVPLTTAPAPSVTNGSTYWIAILSPTGILQFRDKVGGAAESSETSSQTNLTSLPSTWTTGTVLSEGPLAGYGAGN